MGRLLVIDDERNVRFSISEVFSESEIEVQSAENSTQGMQIIADWNPDVILLDLRLGNESGLNVFQQIREIDAKALVIFMTGFGTAEIAIQAMKQGAFDYLVKPLDTVQLRDLVRQGCQIRKLVNVPAFVGESTAPDDQPQQIIGGSSKMRSVCKQIGRVADQNVNVLLQGETGTGKELVARAIYHHSRRSSGPFFAISCAAMPETPLESELFGHEKGAFPGAHQMRIGKLEQCDGGTLLIDEIGEMPLITQSKLLRFLQDSAFERIGGIESIQSKVRILATTSQDLESRIQQHKFRRDLLYRLRGVTIKLPPLRERREDIPELAHHFLFRSRTEVGNTVTSISSDALEQMMNYSWPGNVREMQNVMHGAVIAAAGSVLLPTYLPPELLQEETTQEESLRPVTDDLAIWLSIPEQLERWLADGEQDLYRKALEEFDRFIIGRVMKSTYHNQARAAELLGLSRITVRNKIRAINKQ